MKIKKNTHKCKNTLYVQKCIFGRCANNKIRRPHYKRTGEQQRKNNQRRAERRAAMLIEYNFNDGDMFLTLTFDDKHLPENTDAAKHSANLFLRRLKYRYDKQKEELKYIQAVEYKNKRIHFHILVNRINGITDADIQKIWKNGLVKNTSIRYNSDYEDYTKLAAYIIKETSKTFNSEGRVFGKRWTASRNLKLPDPVEEIKDGDENDLLDTPLTDTFLGREYELIKGSEYIGVNAYTGLPYVEYAMREIKPPRGSKSRQKQKNINGGNKKADTSTNHGRVSS